MRQSASSFHCAGIAQSQYCTSLAPMGPSLVSINTEIKYYNNGYSCNFGLQCRWRYLPAIGNLSSFTIHPTGPVLDHATWCPSQGPVTLPHETDEHQYSDTALTAAWHGILVGVFVGLGQHLTSEHWSEVIGARCKQIFTSAAQRCGEQDRTGGRTSSPG